MNQIPVRAEIQLVLLVTVLMAIGMWTYHSTTGNLFVWDSVHYLFKYKSHISGLSFENLSWMATSLEFYNWHPLTWFSWAIDYQIHGGLNPWGFHFSNNLLHTINGILVFVLILTVFALVEPKSGTFSMRKDLHSLIAAFLASTLFMVHPQHVESVAWVAERKDLLCQLFLLLSLLAYVRYVTSSQLLKKRWYIVTFGMFFLAVISKPMAVTFPVVLLLADVYPLRRTILAKPLIGSVQIQSAYRLVIEKIPFFLLSLVLVFATLTAQESAIASIAEMPLITRFINAINSSVFYLEKFLLPIQLYPHYPYLQVTGSAGVLKAVLVTLVFSGITVAAFLAWRRQKRAWLVAWGFYLVTLSPVLGLIQVGVHGAADRYVYFPTLPLYIFVAGGVLWVLETGSNFRKTLVLLIAMVVIFLFTFQTRQQIDFWKSEFSLWTYVVEVQPDSVLARNNLGIVYMNNDDYESAAIHFDASKKVGTIKPNMLPLRGLTYMHVGRYQESIADFVDLGLALETKPELQADPNCIQYNIAWNFAHMGMSAEAIDLFERVDVESLPGPDAGLWLDELSKVKSQDHKAVLSEDLPSSCKDLIPAEFQKQDVQ